MTGGLRSEFGNACGDESLAGRPATYVAGGLKMQFHAHARAPEAWVMGGTGGGTRT